MLGKLGDQLRGQREVHVLGDVVQHHRQRRFIREAAVVRAQLGELHRTGVVVRHHDQHGVGAGARGRHAARHRLPRALGAAAGNEPTLSVSSAASPVEPATTMPDSPSARCARAFRAKPSTLRSSVPATKGAVTGPNTRLRVRISFRS